MLPFAPHWVELYRRQRRFPRRAFWLLTIIGRSFLNAVLMMGGMLGGGVGVGRGSGGRPGRRWLVPPCAWCALAVHAVRAVHAVCVLCMPDPASPCRPQPCPPAAARPACAVYPIQTGTLHVALVARHRRQLMALGDALADTCDLLGDVLVQNAPVRWGALGARRQARQQHAACSSTPAATATATAPTSRTSSSCAASALWPHPPVPLHARSPGAPAAARWRGCGCWRLGTRRWPPPPASRAVP